MTRLLPHEVEAVATMEALADDPAEFDDDQLTPEEEADFAWGAVLCETIRCIRDSLPYGPARTASLRQCFAELHRLAKKRPGYDGLHDDLIADEALLAGESPGRALETIGISAVVIDRRALIRQAKAYEATTGPPPRSGNEKGRVCSAALPLNLVGKPQPDEFYPQISGFQPTFRQPAICRSGAVRPWSEKASPTRPRGRR